MPVKPLNQGQLYDITSMEFLQVRYALRCCHFDKKVSKKLFVNISEGAGSLKNKVIHSPHTTCVHITLPAVSQRNGCD